jgi:hypothetical protein
MKKFLIALNIVVWSIVGVEVAHAEDVQPETKQVCKEVKGKKQCKTIKIHKKFEGTAVPEKKKK